MVWTLWSGIITSGNWFTLKVLGCVLAITTGVFLCSERFGDVRVFMFGDLQFIKWETNLQSKGGNFCADGGFCTGDFCVESFTIFEMGDKLSNGEEKLLVDGIDEALEKY